jgi:hypothetical protein
MPETDKRRLMRRRHMALSLVVVVAIAFAFFVPVIPSGGHLPSDCVHCPLGLVPYSSSLTYTFLGAGAVHNHFGYYFGFWGVYLSP